MPVCKKCNSQNTTKNGFVRNKQRYKCKDCEFNFTEGDSRTNQSIIVKRALAVILYSLGKASLGFIGKLFGVHKTTILKWIRSEGRNLKDPQFKPEITEVEIDEMWHFLKKRKKLWILEAVDRNAKRTIAWVTGNRSSKTVKRLYEKLKHLNCTYYTDNWEAFSKVLPKERHVIGKKHTITIEQDNSNTRHNLARMTRRTKVVSQSEEMVNLSMRLWCNLRMESVFKHYQGKFLSIFG